MKPSFKNSSRSLCIDLFPTNDPRTFQKTTGLSFYDKLIITVVKYSFIKLKQRKAIMGIIRNSIQIYLGYSWF